MNPGDTIRLLVPRLKGQPGDIGVISCKWKNGGFMVRFPSDNPDKPIVRHCYEHEVELVERGSCEEKRGLIAR